MSSAKSSVLKNQGLLNPHPDNVAAEAFHQHEFFDPLDLLQVKYEMLRCVHAGELSVSQAARLHGFSRPAFYQILHAFQEEGIAGLLPSKRGPREAHKLNARVMDYILELRSSDSHIPVITLLQRIQERFSLRVHRRTLERALKRLKKKRLDQTST